jgi:hypothetical protein
LVFAAGRRGARRVLGGFRAFLRVRVRRRTLAGRFGRRRFARFAMKATLSQP